MFACSPDACPLVGDALDDCKPGFEDDRRGISGTIWPSGSAVCGPEVVLSGAVTPSPSVTFKADASLLTDGCVAEDGDGMYVVPGVFGLASDEAAISILLGSASCVVT